VRAEDRFSATERQTFRAARCMTIIRLRRPARLLLQSRRAAR
jgi:hypothetical protein